MRFDFSLRFRGPEELNDDQADTLFEAGCGDALFGLQNGEYFLDFHRKAPTFRVALISAISDVERANVGLELVRVEPI